MNNPTNLLAFRRPDIHNPYPGYVRICIWTVIATLLVALVTLLLPQPWRILLPVVLLTYAFIAGVTGLILRSYVDIAEQRIIELHANCQAYWTYSAEDWNSFVDRQCEELQTENLIPISLFPCCALSVGAVLGLLNGWIWMVISVFVGILLAIGVSAINRRIREQRYQRVRGTAEVVISPDLLAVPGYTLVWNGFSPELIDVVIQEDKQFDHVLVFEYLLRAANNYNNCRRHIENKIFRSISLPIPPDAISTAEAIVHDFNADDDDEDIDEEE